MSEQPEYEWNADDEQEESEEQDDYLSFTEFDPWATEDEPEESEADLGDDEY